MDLLTAVLGANLLTAMFIWGALTYTKAESRNEHLWGSWAMMALPLAVLMLGLLSTGELPPYFDAIAVQ